MTARIIDGAAVAKELRQTIGAQVQEMKAQYGVVPGLAVVLVGQDPASQVYVRNKTKACDEAGFKSFGHHLPVETTQAELLKLIASLNADPEVHGILVQLPLPPHIKNDVVINAIDPMKDVDGFHPVNVGRLAAGMSSFVPCTPQGCMLLIREATPDLRGKRALIVGRSNIVGKPMAMLLLKADCTVTIAHSQTLDLAIECRRADILIAAIGKPEFVRGDWIKPGATVVDVGINRIPAPEGKSRLVGDVAFDEAASRAGAITPVPGGVGPMTIACLLQNTLQSAAIHLKHKPS
jgi:methylenetetrahydrofolate dehydrogenase (NADP+)/methenyltetrahydrofolate cyclohydrolase